MAAGVNGMVVSRIQAFGATFFNFSDYMRASIRLAALMEIPSIFIFTHDSIGVGEDGPTHQPIEQLASLRAMPNLLVIRPGDANEVTESWKIIAQFNTAGCAGTDPAKYANSGPHEIWPGLGNGQGRLHFRRRAQRQARRYSDGHR